MVADKLVTNLDIEFSAEVAVFSSTLNPKSGFKMSVCLYVVAVL